MGSAGSAGSAAKPPPALGPDRAVEVVATPINTCARMVDDTVRCWGGGTLEERLTPTPVEGIHDATQLRGAQGGICVRRSDGQVVCRGAISFLTNGHDTVFPVPTLARVEELWMHDQDGCARLVGGALVCWGAGAGAIAVGSPNDNGMNPSPPAPVVAALREATAFSLSEQLGCARISDGTVACWGENDRGQVGDGTTRERLAPVAVKGLTGIAEVATGRDFACARDDRGGVACWGANTRGQLGDASRVASPIPKPVPGVRDVVELALGEQHACARHRDGTVSCWGSNQLGLLGRGLPDGDGLPAKVTGLADVMQLSAGTAHTCAVKRAGSIACWGANFSGMLGDGTQVARTTPVDVAWRVVQRTGTPLPAGVRVERIGVGYMHACAGLSDGTVRCWGGNADGQVTGTAGEPVSIPTTVPGLATATALRVAGTVSEATRSDGTIVAWGQGYRGVMPAKAGTREEACVRAADGTLACTAMEKTATLHDTIAYATGIGGGCGLRTDGTVHCMGINFAGGLGDGTTTPRLTFAPVPKLAKVVQLVSASGWMCARHASGAVSCWGGDPGRGMEHHVPVAVDGLADAAELFAGMSGVCARRSTGEVACWGWFAVRDLDTPDLRRITPTPIAWLRGARAIGIHETYGCALVEEGVVCWGDNTHGQLGDGTFTRRNEGVPVRW